MLESLIVKKLLKNILSKFNLKLVNNKLYNDELKKSISASDLEFLKTCKNENLKKLFDYFKDSKSQLRQDLFVINELNFKKKGFFCEFGACDGVELSNSYLLEKNFNWQGIVCEPAKFYKKKIKENRKCNIELKCVSNIEGEQIDFKETVDKCFSTVNKYSKDDKHTKERRNGKIYKVETISLNNLLLKYNCPNNFDYLSVDTEGSEYEIISSLDFNTYSPKIITIEHNYNVEKRNKIFEFLKSKEYLRVNEKISLFDDWYIKS